MSNMNNVRQLLLSTSSRGSINILSTFKSPITATRSYARYKSAREYDPDEKIDFEASKNPEEWKYVSRLLPVKFVPDPVSKPSYPSGWTLPKPESVESPYFVRRSRNHMIPVYLTISHRGFRRLTTIRHVMGDIWLFIEELKKFLEKELGHSVGYKVDEVGCKVVLRGDYCHLSEQFLRDKGF